VRLRVLVNPDSYWDATFAKPKNLYLHGYDDRSNIKHLS
jgi:hypothetical protein